MFPLLMQKKEGEPQNKNKKYMIVIIYATFQHGFAVPNLK